MSDKQKSETRKLAEQIQALNGMSLISISKNAFELVAMGFVKTRLEALQYIFDMESDNF